MLRKFFSLQFGSVSVEDIFSAIFVLGSIPITIFIFYKTFIYARLGYGSIVTIIYLLLISLFFIFVAIAVWKIICELLFLIFKSLKVFIDKNS